MRAVSWLPSTPRAHALSLISPLPLTRAGWYYRTWSRKRAASRWARASPVQTGHGQRVEAWRCRPPRCGTRAQPQAVGMVGTLPAGELPVGSSSQQRADERLQSRAPLHVCARPSHLWGDKRPEQNVGRPRLRVAAVAMWQTVHEGASPLSTAHVTPCHFLQQLTCTMALLMAHAMAPWQDAIIALVLTSQTGHTQAQICPS